MGESIRSINWVKSLKTKQQQQNKKSPTGYESINLIATKTTKPYILQPEGKTRPCLFLFSDISMKLILVFCFLQSTITILFIKTI